MGEDAPWLLASNLLSEQETLRAYRRRMWVDEMFGDWKGHGFDLESTHLIHFQRLSRLTLAVAFPVCLAGCYGLSRYQEWRQTSGRPEGA
jgi:hypothetical protein